MKKVIQEINVYEALLHRLEFIFNEFDNIYVSFSGGKDSCLLLNLIMDYKRNHYPDRIIGVFHQDFEAQYMLVWNPPEMSPGRSIIVVTWLSMGLLICDMCFLMQLRC